MNKINARIAELEHELKHTEHTAQKYWAMWKALRERTNELAAEIRQLEEELNNEP